MSFEDIYHDFIHSFHMNINSSQACPSLGLGDVSCLISELQKLSSPELKPKAGFQCCGLRSCTLLVETTFVLATFFCRAQLLSLRLELKALFWSFDLSKISLWVEDVSVPSFGQTGMALLKL
jgi:hypothetical protein